MVVRGFGQPMTKMQSEAPFAAATRIVASRTSADSEREHCATNANLLKETVPNAGSECAVRSGLVPGSTESEPLTGVVNRDLKAGKLRKTQIAGFASGRKAAHILAGQERRHRPKLQRTDSEIEPASLLQTNRPAYRHS
jgi:hypothetical protein